MVALPVGFSLHSTCRSEALYYGRTPCRFQSSFDVCQREQPASSTTPSSPAAGCQLLSVLPVLTSTGEWMPVSSWFCRRRVGGADGQCWSNGF